ncbi:MAG: N-acetylmuramoyl-L-alanine amidase [Acidimicrobiales bacterium]
MAVVASFLVPLRWVEADVMVRTRAFEACGPIADAVLRALPFGATHVALHWSGNPDAAVSVAFSRDNHPFGAATPAERDEVGEQRGKGRTYGALLAADGASAVRIQADRVIGHLCVLGLTDGEPIVDRRIQPGGRPAAAAVAQPAIQPRSAWGADESLRFNGTGTEAWPTEFHPIQKLVVHHTATKNRDRDPKATIRSIYYYHAVTQGWGDIGYNFLVDEAGVIYKGRHSHLPGSAGDTITGEDGSGNGVTAAHAYGYNSGTVGVAFLGTLTAKDATPAAKGALQTLLAWKASTHGIDPLASTTYVNPATGTPTPNVPNIAAHRDVNATECPGKAFYKTLPTVRANVAGLVAAGGT